LRNFFLTILHLIWGCEGYCPGDLNPNVTDSKNSNYLCDLCSKRITYKIIYVAFRIEPSISVLVCSRGGGGLLTERMELVAELWKANIKVVL